MQKSETFNMLNMCPKKALQCTKNTKKFWICFKLAARLQAAALNTACILHV